MLMTEIKHVIIKISDKQAERFLSEVSFAFTHSNTFSRSVSGSEMLAAVSGCLKGRMIKKASF